MPPDKSGGLVSCKPVRLPVGAFGNLSFEIAKVREGPGQHCSRTLSWAGRNNRGIVSCCGGHQTGPKVRQQVTVTMMNTKASWLLVVAVWHAGSLGHAEAPDNLAAIADEEQCRSLGLAVHGPALLQFFRQRMPSADDLKNIESLVEQLGSAAFKVREGAAAKLVGIGPAALPQLRQAAKKGALEQARRAERCIQEIERNVEGAPAAARLLKLRKPEGACAVLLNYLAVVDDEDAVEAILDALQTLGVQNGAIDPDLLAALKDQAASRRAAAALVVGCSGTTEQRRFIRSLQNDPDAQVRLRAAQGLIAARQKLAVPTLIALLAEAPLPLAIQAEYLLRRVAGDNTDIPRLGETDDLRRKCAVSWEAWWRANENKLELNGADVAQPTTGPARRASETALRFVNALRNGDGARACQLSDVPFAMAGAVTINSREELEALYKEVRQPAQKRTPLIERVGSLEEYARGCGETAEDFLDKKDQAGVRVVYVSTREGREIDRSVVLVRINGVQVRVVGVGHHPSTRKR